MGPQNIFVINRWLLYRNTVNNDRLIKWSLCTGSLKKSACQIWRENDLGWNQPFTKFAVAANNLTKLIEKGKHFTKFVKLTNSFTKLVEFPNNFTKFVDWKVGFKNLKVVLYLSFTRLNISIGKHKCILFMNTFHK